MDDRTVGQVAKATGLTVRTLHHYDDIGLVTPSGRSASGYRLYSDAESEADSPHLAKTPLANHLPGGAGAYSSKAASTTSRISLCTASIEREASITIQRCGSACAICK